QLRVVDHEPVPVGRLPGQARGLQSSCHVDVDHATNLPSAAPTALGVAVGDPAARRSGVPATPRPGDASTSGAAGEPARAARSGRRGRRASTHAPARPLLVTSPRGTRTLERLPDGWAFASP